MFIFIYCNPLYELLVEKQYESLVTCVADIFLLFTVLRRILEVFSYLTIR